jgi:hypothetical protein
MMAEHGATHDRLDDIFNPAVDRDDPRAQLHQADGMNSFEATQFEDLLSGQLPAPIKLNNTPIGNRLSGRALLG